MLSYQLNPLSFQYPSEPLINLGNCLILRKTTEKNSLRLGLGYQQGPYFMEARRDFAYDFDSGSYNTISLFAGYGRRFGKKKSGFKAGLDFQFLQSRFIGRFVSNTDFGFGIREEYQKLGIRGQSSFFFGYDLQIGTSCLISMESAISVSLGDFGRSKDYFGFPVFFGISPIHQISVNYVLKSN
jgi:hypothetical protein